MRRTEKHGPGGASLAGRVLAALLGVVLSAGLVPARGLAEAVVELGGPVASAAETIGEIEAADGSGAPEAGRAASVPPRAAEGTDAGDGEDEGVTLEAQDEEVTYLEASLDASGAVVYTEKVVPGRYTTVTSSTKTLDNGGWYVVDGVVTRNNIVVVSGTANLVLKDGCDFKVMTLAVCSDTVLNVYAQSESESAGMLTVRQGANSSYACIGGMNGTKRAGCGTINIHGGRITAWNHSTSAIGGGMPVTLTKGGDGGAVTVYGGVVEAMSGACFAIGGGAPEGDYAYGSGGTVAVYGGTVTAVRTDGTGSPAIGGSDGGTLTIGSGLRVMGSDDSGSTYDVLIANGPCTNLGYASRTPYMRIEPIPEPPLPKIEGVSWLFEEPLAGWNGGPESTHHYKVVATATKGDGTTATSEKTVPYVSGGSSADFSDFAEEQGDGEYAFEVTAYDEAGSPLACGRSDEQTFYRVEMHVSVLDEEDEPLEGVQHGCSLMLTVDGSGSSSDYRPVQCRAGGAAELLARPANGYRFLGFSIDRGDGKANIGENPYEFTENPYEFTLGAGFKVTATFQQDTTEIPATLHVGEGHEEYAQQIADALNAEHGQGYAQVAEGGADVTYRTLGAQTLRSAASDLQPALWTLGQPSPGYLLGARPSYQSFEEYNREMYGEDPAQLGDRLDLYLVWYRAVPQVAVSVDAPVCGTQVVADGPEWHPEQTPAPAVDVDGDDAACGGSWWSARGETVAFSGTIEGGATYTAHVSLTPAFGYVFDDTTAVRANGRAVEAELGSDGLAVEVPVVAEHDWAAGACAGCSARQRTVAFDANGGSGTMESVSVADGQAYTLPACGFTAPAGTAFAGWLVGDATSASPVGAAITVSGDVTLRAAWDALPSKPEFRSCYLVLSGLIGVTFTVAVPQGFEAGESRMDFKVRGEASSSVRMAGLEPDAYGRYHFTCYINSVQMADSISATLLYGEGLSESVSASYSVQEYLGYIDGHPEDYDQATIDLARAINDYGYYAQIYLSAENHWVLGEGGKHAAMTKAYTKSYDYSAIKGEVEQYAISKDLGESGVKVSYRLHLDSGTGISVRVRPAADGVKVMADSVVGRFNGKTYRAEEQPDGSYVVRVDGIPAHRLADGLAVEGLAQDADSNKKYFRSNVCALSYARTVFNASGNVTEVTKAKNAMAAFYRYYVAVEAYR